MRSTRLSPGERVPAGHRGRMHQAEEMVRDRYRMGLISGAHRQPQGGSGMSGYGRGAFATASEEEICL
jgi:hypothetical protein